MSHRLLLVLLLGALSGCVTRADIRGLQDDLYGIQKDLQANLGNVKDQTDSVQTTQADLLNNMNELSQNLAALKVELADNQARMKLLSQRLDDVEAGLSARMDAQIELLSGSKFVESPLPSTIYNLANSDFSRGRYSEAIKGFQTYIKTFPRGEQLSEARFKIADSYSRLKQDKEAVSMFDELIETHPKDPLVVTAMLKKAQILESSIPASSLKIYESIIKNYPYRSEANVARERLNSLKSQNLK